MYADYKGGRAKHSDEFCEYLFIHEQLDHLGTRHYELAQGKADDDAEQLIRCSRINFVLWCDSLFQDKDLIQLTDDNICGWNLKKGVAEFEEFTQPIWKRRWTDIRVLIDLKALTGR